MSVIALVTWITTAGGGMYLLSIWLIEYDKDFQAAAATRLPPVVLASHVLLAVGGLIVWTGYLFFDNDNLTWVAVAALGLAATLGLFMANRWIGVYRDGRARGRPARTGSGPGRTDLGPPERNFPLPVVIAHGLFATLTVTLVVLVAFGVGGS